MGDLGVSYKAGIKSHSNW